MRETVEAAVPALSNSVITYFAAVENKGFNTFRASFSPAEVSTREQCKADHVQLFSVLVLSTLHFTPSFSSTGHHSFPRATTKGLLGDNCQPSDGQVDVPVT